MRLIDLITATTATLANGAEAAGTAEIQALTADSRTVEPGTLFAALPGTRANGTAFIEDAVQRGATAVLAPTGTERHGDAAQTTLVTANRPRQALSLMAARFHPGQPAFIGAVTGTNGKTSVAAFCRQIWAHVGCRAASLGTMGLVPEIAPSPGALTTPDPVALHRCLSELAAQDVQHLAIEASSHGLDQERLDGLALKAAVFTNLTQDHLDYHPNMEAYFRAKARLFAELLPSDGTAILNADTPQTGALLEICRQRGLRTWLYGRDDSADLRLEGRHTDPGGQDIRLSLFDQEVRLRLPLVGRFQVMNALAALGVAAASSVPMREAVEALAHLEGAPGRMQKVAETATGAAIFVDYAHTPDALATVLEALRPHAKERLIVVFGAGGDRDRGKRPLMGRVAAERADRVIVTDDNPRGEDPAAIRRAILDAVPNGEEIGDRAAAIQNAIADLSAGDVALIAGKGHETGQIIGDTTLPFEDTTVAREAVTGQQAGESK